MKQTNTKQFWKELVQDYLYTSEQEETIEDFLRRQNIKPTKRIVKRLKSNYLT